MKTPLNAFIPFIALPLLLASCASHSTEKISLGGTQPVLSVLGVSNAIERDEWKDQRVGLGLRLMLTEALHSTGKFRMVEEKAEVKQRTNEIAAGIWAGIYGDSPLESTELKTLSTDFLATARIVYFGRPRSKASFGIVHINRKSIDIEVEVSLKRQSDGKILKSRAMGSADTKANSLLFEYKDDGSVERTAVGNATRQAVQKAVDLLANRLLP